MSFAGCASAPSPTRHDAAAWDAPELNAEGEAPGLL